MFEIYILQYRPDIWHLCSITHNVLVLQYKHIWISYEKHMELKLKVNSMM